MDINLFAVQRASGIARGASAFCLGFSFALGKNFIDEEFGNNNVIFRRHEGTQMFKATVLNFIAVAGTALSRARREGMMTCEIY